MKEYVFSFGALALLLVVMVFGAVLVPTVIALPAVLAFFFSLVKACAVVCCARLALTYFDRRAGINVNSWLKDDASNQDKAIYFSVRFIAVFFVFGFVLA